MHSKGVMILQIHGSGHALFFLGAGGFWNMDDQHCILSLNASQHSWDAWYHCFQHLFAAVTSHHIRPRIKRKSEAEVIFYPNVSCLHTWSFKQNIPFVLIVPVKIKIKHEQVSSHIHSRHCETCFKSGFQCDLRRLLFLNFLQLVHCKIYNCKSVY